MEASILEKIVQAMQNANLPGLAAAVFNREEVLFSGGFGLRRLGETDSVDGDTIFGIASNTKAFTAAAVAMLVDAGQLNWDAPVLDYLPEFQLYDALVTRQVTLRDLLAHRLGLATWGGDLTWYGSTYSLAEVLRRMRYQPPAYAFRTDFGYCNLAFMTAGLIVERVSGVPFGQFLDERIFKPLGMARTRTSTLQLPGMENVAAPHTLVNGMLAPVPYRVTDNNTAAGGILSSVNELSRWLRMQLNEGVWQGQRLISPSALEIMRTPHTLVVRPAEMRALNPLIHLSAYGLGFQLADYRGHLMLQHGGALDGMLSMSAILPEEGLGVVVLTNADNHLMHNSALYTLVDAALGLGDPMDWTGRYQRFYDEREAQKAAKLNLEDAQRARDSQPSHALADYCGQYNSALYGDLLVTLEGGVLTLLPQAHPDVRGPLTHWQYDTFTAAWSEPVWGSSRVLFALDEAGRVDSLQFKVAPDYLDPLTYVFSRVG